MTTTNRTELNNIKIACWLWHRCDQALPRLSWYMAAGLSPVGKKKIIYIQEINGNLKFFFLLDEKLSGKRISLDSRIRNVFNKRIFMLCVKKKKKKRKIANWKIDFLFQSNQQLLFNVEIWFVKLLSTTKLMFSSLIYIVRLYASSSLIPKDEHSEDYFYEMPQAEFSYDWKRKTKGAEE